MEGAAAPATGLMKIDAKNYIEPISAFAPQVKKGTDILNSIKEITNPQSCQSATEWLQKGKALTTAVNKKVDDICRPFKDLKADIDTAQRQLKATAEETMKPITEAIAVLERKIIAFNKEQQRIADEVRRQQLEAIKKADEERQAAIRKQQEEAAAAEAEGREIPEPEPLPAPVVETAPVVVAPKPRGLATIWKYEITDETLIPREYLTPDTAKINAAVKAGTREIPGTRIFSEDMIKKA